MSRIGMDVANMHHVADELERTAKEVNGIVFRVNAHIDRGIFEWFGEMAFEYANSWRIRSKAHLLIMEVQLLMLARTLRAQIAEQERTSAADGSLAAIVGRLREHQSATYDHGKLRVTAGPTFSSHGPRNVSDLLNPLHNNKLGHSADPHSVYHYPGGISVSFTGSPPHRHAIVTVSGTEQLIGPTKNLDDQTTNIGNAFGRYTEKEAAIEQALLRSGVSSTDSIMIVGHSQGGADAIAFSHDYAKDARFHVASIVTVGAPDAPKNPPANVDVLELRGMNDIVPNLGPAIPGPGSSVHRVWVPESPWSSVLTAHDPAYYQQNLPDSQQIDDFQRRQSGFFTGGTTETTYYANDRVR